MLSITHLKKSFGDSVAVDDVSFDVRDGETVGLLGPNGAGKTTTLSMMSGIAQPDGGSVSFRGQLVRPDADELKRCVGLVTQDLALYDPAPTRWAVDGLDDMTWRGLGFDAAIAPLVVLSLSAAVCLAIAIWRFRWEE